MAAPTRSPESPVEKKATTGSLAAPSKPESTLEAQACPHCGELAHVVERGERYTVLQHADGSRFGVQDGGLAAGDAAAMTALGPRATDTLFPERAMSPGPWMPGLNIGDIGHVSNKTGCQAFMVTVIDESKNRVSGHLFPGRPRSAAFETYVVDEAVADPRMGSFHRLHACKHKR